MRSKSRSLEHGSKVTSTSVSQRKVLDEENQDFLGFGEQSCQSVRVTREVCGDNKSVSVSKIEMVGASEKAKAAKDKTP